MTDLLDDPEARHAIALRAAELIERSGTALANADPDTFLAAVAEAEQEFRERGAALVVRARDAQRGLTSEQRRLFVSRVAKHVMADEWKLREPSAEDYLRAVSLVEERFGSLLDSD